MPGPRPRQVSYAILLLYIVLGVAVARSIADAPATLEMAGIPFMMLVLFLAFGTMLLFITLISCGKNWARIAFFVVFVLGFVPAILGLLRYASDRPISGLLGLTQVILQVLALILLFQRESSEWFRDNAKRTNSGGNSKVL